MINLSKYDLSSPNTTAYNTLVQDCRKALNETGLCVLPDFIQDQTLQKILAETASIEDQAFFKTVSGNAYLNAGDDNLPADHALNMKDTTSLGVLAYDQIDAQHQLRKLYHDPKFIRFIQDCINRGPLFEYACPYGKVNISIMKKGDYLRWHFDQSDFVVSIPLRPAESGGIYEYVHHIRSTESENYEAVKALLNGDKNQVKILETPPGSLVLFEGKYTIHRVTKVAGKTPRLIALYGYAMEPNVTSTPHLRKMRYGRE